MKKRNVCVLFGGMSPEHEAALKKTMEEAGIL